MELPRLEAQVPLPGIHEKVRGLCVDVMSNSAMS